MNSLSSSTETAAPWLRESQLACASWPAWLWADLRSDHAGETGAIWIYKGVLAVSRDVQVRAFAHAHLQTESRHLQEVSAIVPPDKRSRLLWLWRVLGWITGAAPSLAGGAPVFATIAAVETFVDQHYQAQIDRLKAEAGDARLAALLDSWRQDEVAHRDDAAHRVHAPPRGVLALWTRLVALGSALAVSAARVV